MLFTGKRHRITSRNASVEQYQAHAHILEGAKPFKRFPGPSSTRIGGGLTGRAAKIRIVPCRFAGALQLLLRSGRIRRHAFTRLSCRYHITVNVASLKALRKPPAPRSTFECYQQHSNGTASVVRIGTVRRRGILP
jgi:hypothetical protein